MPGEARRPEWWFYHLGHTSLEAAAGPLLEKCLARGWRVLAACPDAATRASLDRALWTAPPGGFLPHGRTDDVNLEPARQPILIAETVDNLNGASALLLLMGAQAPVEADFERCMVMFDGEDANTRARARAQFKAAKAAGLTCRYFQQTPGGGWNQAGA